MEKILLSGIFPKPRLNKVDLSPFSRSSGAYFTSPWENALIVTMDGAGNFLSSIVAAGKSGKIKKIAKTFIPSFGGSVLGKRYKGLRVQIRHKAWGEVTGLAASGDSNKLIDKFRQVIKCDGLRLKTKKNFF